MIGAESNKGGKILLRGKNTESLQGFNVACSQITGNNKNSTCDYMNFTCDNINSKCDNINITCDNINFTCDDMNSTCHNKNLTCDFEISHVKIL